MTQLYGLIGYPLGHSFSKKYFSEKFEKEGINQARYELFPLADISEFSELTTRYEGRLRGLNVTIPYKQKVIPFLDGLDETAARVGAVNCIQFTSSGKRIGFNTDVTGFEQSLRSFEAGRWIGPSIQAFILGTGGAAKAVQYVLEKLQTPYISVSRQGGQAGMIDYTTFNQRLENLPKTNRPSYLIVHTTPLGMSPDIDSCPPVQFQALGPHFFVFDLVYNPLETLLLRRARLSGCATQNGLEMLHLQAEAAWQIWQSA